MNMGNASNVNPFATFQPSFPSGGETNGPSFTVENVFGQNAFPSPAPANTMQQPSFNNPAFSAPQPNPIFGAPAQPSQAATIGQYPSMSGVPQVTDHLAGLNPFAKPSIPLAAMSSTTTSSSPFGFSGQGGNPGMPFAPQGAIQQQQQQQQQASPFASVSNGAADFGQPANNSNNPFLRF
ncbi:hypothetical protein BC829DRAFT_265053 [Chytridium lagenaria]|nr:hypothetical protein BC829DRAFT_265053 [Chytridium lagenaria]